MQKGTAEQMTSAGASCRRAYNFLIGSSSGVPRRPPATFCAATFALAQYCSRIGILCIMSPVAESLGEADESRGAQFSRKIAGR